MEDKCKLNFDLHVCHQLLNIQAKISQFLSARAKEKNKKKKTHEQGNYETHHQRKTLNWTLYHALKFFTEKFRPKRIPSQRKTTLFPLHPAMNQWSVPFPGNHFPQFTFIHPHTSPYTRILQGSVFDPLLRNERNEKRFSHTHMGVWVRVCGGSSGHMVFQSPVIFVALMRCKRIGEIE